MQWILLLAGLVIGALLDESLIGGVVGAAIGLSVGLSLRLSTLSQEAARQKTELAQTRLDLQAIQQRLGQLDSAAVQMPDAPAATPLDIEPISDAGPELIWDLPDLEPAEPEPATSAQWRPSPDPTHRAAADRLTDVRQHLAESVFGRSADRAETVGALTAEKERLERLLASAGGRAETLTPAALCAHLGPDEALVDYVRYTRRGEAVTTDGVRAEADPVLSYLAFVFVGGCDAPARIELGPAAPIEAALKAWRRGVAAGKSVDRRGAELRAALWTPLEAALATRTRIAVLPDGVLSGLPFGALPDGDGYLVERVTLAYPGTAAALVRSPAQPGAGALVVGGVDYASGAVAEDALATRSPSRGGLPMSFLPGTAAEADAIVGLLGDGTDRLSGGQATEAQVRARLPGRRVAHIATHGFFAAAGGDDGVVAPGSEAALRTSPLLRTGLVLAGAASDTPRPGGDDGLLTAEEILGLDLTGLELVVLSACETGLGAVEDGEGVMGMRRAFSLAGAGTLVLSLWKVPDEPTRALMTALYGRLTAGDDPATALTTAQTKAAMAKGTRSFFAPWYCRPATTLPWVLTAKWRMLSLGLSSRWLCTTLPFDKSR